MLHFCGIFKPLQSLSTTYRKKMFTDLETRQAFMQSRSILKIIYYLQKFEVKGSKYRAAIYLRPSNKLSTISRLIERKQKVKC